MENTAIQTEANPFNSDGLPVERAPAQLEVEQTRATQEVQAALIIAKRFPRNEADAYDKIMKACKRPVLAEQAIYKLPISGKIMEGPSIRLAEVLIQAWGNAEFGIREISRDNNRSNCEAFCWDKETNIMRKEPFIVEHHIEKNETVNNVKRKIKKPVTDPVEIDRLIANRGGRKLRNCILNIIPGDVVDAAVKACRQTMVKGSGEPLSDRVRKAVAAFSELAVSREMIEERLGHPVDITTAEEVADLLSIYNSLINKQAKRGEFFRVPEAEGSDEQDEVAARIASMGQ